MPMYADLSKMYTIQVGRLFLGELFTKVESYRIFLVNKTGLRQDAIIADLGDQTW